MFVSRTSLPVVHPCHSTPRSAALRTDWKLNLRASGQRHPQLPREWDGFLGGYGQSAQALKKTYEPLLTERYRVISRERQTWGRFVILPSTFTSSEFAAVRSILSEASLSHHLTQNFLPHLRRQFGSEVMLLNGPEVGATLPYRDYAELADFFIGRFHRYAQPRSGELGEFRKLAEVDVKIVYNGDYALERAFEQFNRRDIDYWQKNGRIIYPKLSIRNGIRNAWKVIPHPNVQNPRWLFTTDANATEDGTLVNGVRVLRHPMGFDDLSRLAKRITLALFSLGEEPQPGDGLNLVKQLKLHISAAPSRTVMLFPIGDKRDAELQLRRTLEINGRQGHFSIGDFGDHFRVSRGSWTNHMDPNGH